MCHSSGQGKYDTRNIHLSQLQVPHMPNKHSFYKCMYPQVKQSTTAAAWGASAQHPSCMQPGRHERMYTKPFQA